MIQDNRKSIVYQFIPGQRKDFVYHIAELIGQFQNLFFLAKWMQPLDVSIYKDIQIKVNPTLDRIQLYVLWMGGAHCTPPPVKCLKRAFFGSNQPVTQKVDKFCAVKWKKKILKGVPKKSKFLKKIQIFFDHLKILKNTF